jgi:diguanylate cyclase (GGDEF)-like protein
VKYLSDFAASAYAVDDLQLFQGARGAEVECILSGCAIMRMTAGEPVLDSHGSGAQLYIVLRGALGTHPGENSQHAGDGTASKVLAGECVGELSVLDDEANPAAVYALEESDVLVIPAPKLWQLIDESNGVARNLLRLLSFRIRAANAQLRKKQKLGEFYRQLSMVDGLTGLQNRAWLEDRLPAMIEESRLTGRPLSVVMIDIDHFKHFNDEYGHQAGDNALQVAAQALGTALRPTDFAARYGGEELIVILPNAERKTGIMVAERLCERMRQSVVFADMRKPLPHITASFGVATLMPDQTAAKLIAQADAALYRAKEAGRDRVAVEA